MGNILENPPIVCMVVETDGKTKDELMMEVRNFVEKEVERQINEIDKGSMTKQDYDKIVATVHSEKRSMLKQFMGQIKSIYNQKESVKASIIGSLV